MFYFNQLDQQLNIQTSIGAAYFVLLALADGTVK